MAGDGQVTFQICVIKFHKKISCKDMEIKKKSCRAGRIKKNIKQPKNLATSPSKI